MSGSNGFLSTHVLDTALGLPAAGLEIDLYRITGETREHLTTVITNDDGRTDSPVLPADAFSVGVYELVFHADAYLDRTTGKVDGPRFLGDIPIRFGIDDADAHYHVPLLLSPFSYSTYRGS